MNGSRTRWITTGWITSSPASDDEELSTEVKDDLLLVEQGSRKRRITTGSTPDGEELESFTDEMTLDSIDPSSG